MEAAKKAADFYGLNFDEEIEEMERTKVKKNRHRVKCYETFLGGKFRNPLKLKSS